MRHKITHLPKEYHKESINDNILCKEVLFSCRPLEQMEKSLNVQCWEHQNVWCTCKRKEKENNKSTVISCYNIWIDEKTIHTELKPEPGTGLN